MALSFLFHIFVSYFLILFLELACYCCCCCCQAYLWREKRKFVFICPTGKSALFCCLSLELDYFLHFFFYTQTRTYLCTLTINWTFHSIQPNRLSLSFTWKSVEQMMLMLSLLLFWYEKSVYAPENKRSTNLATKFAY